MIRVIGNPTSVFPAVSSNFTWVHKGEYEKEIPWSGDKTRFVSYCFIRNNSVKPESFAFYRKLSFSMITLHIWEWYSFSQFLAIYVFLLPEFQVLLDLVVLFYKRKKDSRMIIQVGLLLVLSCPFFFLEKDHLGTNTKLFDRVIWGLDL